MGKQVNIPQLRFPKFNNNWNEDALDNVATFTKDKGISKADIAENGVTECIRYGELYTTYGETINKVVSKTNVNEENLLLSEANDVIIPASGETQLDIAFDKLVKEEKLSSEKTEKLIEDYLFAEKTPLRDEVLELLEGEKPSLLQRKELGDRILSRITDFVETFINGMTGN